MTKPLTLTPLPDVPLIAPGDDLVKIIQDGLKRARLRLQDDDVIVIAQKIVSKAEGRFVNLVDVQPSIEALDLARLTQRDPRFVELILQESNQVIRTRPGVIIVEHRLGFVCASAGIDHSNVPNVDDRSGEWVLLLPENPDASARDIQAGLQANEDVRIGVAIIDSHGRAWRLGTVGIAIGLAGLPGLVDLRGEPDLFGFKLQITLVGAVDELAAAASLVMGQADEATPLVHVRGFPYPLREASLSELLRPPGEDLFR